MVIVSMLCILCATRIRAILYAFFCAKLSMRPVARAGAWEKCSPEKSVCEVWIFAMHTTTTWGRPTDDDSPISVAGPRIGNEHYLWNNLISNPFSGRVCTHELREGFSFFVVVVCVCFGRSVCPYVSRFARAGGLQLFIPWNDHLFGLRSAFTTLLLVVLLLLSSVTVVICATYKACVFSAHSQSKSCAPAPAARWTPAHHLHTHTNAHIPTSHALSVCLCGNVFETLRECPSACRF